jgi:queuine tRNA-ribosyltransferase accessory subunit
MADQDMVFTILHGAATGVGPRCGRLALQGRVALDTPTFIGITSRGVVPHLTPDVYSKYSELHGCHMALEDC